MRFEARAEAVRARRASFLAFIQVRSRVVVSDRKRSNETRPGCAPGARPGTIPTVARAADDRTEARPGLDPGEVVPADIPGVGDVIADKYRVERIVGVGGMGVVMAVTHLQIGEPYAIKFLRPGSQRDPETVARFMREARAAVRIKSDHIVRVNDVGQLADGSPFILMEYLVGQDVADELKERGPLPVRDAVEYVLQACAGIAEAHALGIVHRDLKPSNLFLTRRSDGAGLVKVLDFGIAKAMDADSPSASLTQTSSAFGSPAYMSPEQVRSAKRVDFRTDVWSLGVILFELLTGTLPFDAETTAGLLAAIAADEPHRVRKYRPDVSEELDAIVRACLEKDVARRIHSVSELAQALEPFATGGVVSVDRIRRLVPLGDVQSSSSSNRYPSAVPPGPFGAPSLSVDAATERALTMSAGRSPTKNRALVPLAVGLAIAGVVGAGAITVRLRTRPASEPVAIPAPTESAPTVITSAATTPAVPDPAPAPPPTLSASAASERRSGGAAPKPTASQRQAPRATPSARATAETPPPSPSPTPPKVPTNVDPTAESH
jgi:eukaryotic-like serine/threonine-protein kinase